MESAIVVVEPVAAESTRTPSMNSSTKFPPRVRCETTWVQVFVEIAEGDVRTRVPLFHDVVRIPVVATDIRNVTPVEPAVMGLPATDACPAE